MHAHAHPTTAPTAPTEPTSPKLFTHSVRMVSIGGVTYPACRNCGAVGSDLLIGGPTCSK